MISSLFRHLLGPVSARLYFRRAEKKYKLGKLDAAADLYRAAIEADKTYKPAYLNFSRLLIETQKKYFHKNKINVKTLSLFPPHFLLFPLH